MQSNLWRKINVFQAYLQMKKNVFNQNQINMKQIVYYFVLSGVILLFLAGFYPQSVYAESWSDRVSAPVINGDTYEVSTGEQLAWIAKMSETSDFTGKVIKLSSDIDLIGSPWIWVPIGVSKPFEGEFDGQGHVIRNLFYYSSEYSCYGLFGQIGTKGHIHHVALASADIASEKGNVGAIAGINGGYIHHCYSMARIMDAKQPVGGLVGENKSGSVIEYCYNTGIILVKSGGLVGLNCGTVRHSYAAGYVHQGDAVAAVSDGAVYEDIHFDSQITAQTNNGGKLLDGISSHITSEMAGIVFSGSDASSHWNQQEGKYPQLSVFAGTDASVVSVTPAYLAMKESVTPEAASMVTTNFYLQTDDVDKWNCDSTRTNKGDLILSVQYGWVTVRRPCMQTPSYLRVYKGKDVKWVYINPQPFNPFVPSDVTASDSILVCPLIGVPMHTYTSPAKFGKDDDEENAPYYYKVDKYVINAPGDTTYVETYGPMPQKDFSKLSLVTGDKGKYAYYVWSKDYQCEADYIKGNGVLVVVVAGEFDAGAVDSLAIDTIYTDFPYEMTVKSLLPATGGDEQMTYRWSYDQYGIADNKRMKHDEIVGGARTPFDSVACRVELPSAGRYVFMREAHDGKCRPDYDEELGTTSRGKKQVVAFNQFTSGAIRGSRASMDTVHFCLVDDAQKLIIHQNVPPTGGDLHYEYRWLVSTDNASPIVVPTAADSVLDCADTGFENGHIYRIYREVKDGTRFTDWTASEDTLVVVMYAPFSSGAITASELPVVCWEPETMQTIRMSATELTAPSGDGEMSYSWQLRINGTSTVPLHATSADMALDFSPTDYASLPATFKLERYVSNSLCGEEQLQSEGGVSIRVGVIESSSESLLVCGDSPEKYDYTRVDGSVVSHTFSKDSEVYVFSDMTKDGCSKTHTVTARLKPVPKVSVEMTDNVCDFDSVLMFTYHVLGGNPGYVQMEFGDRLQALGMQSMSRKLDEGTDVRFAVPYLPPGDYELYVQFYEDSTGTCMSSPDTLAFTMNLAGYVYQKWDDVLFVDNNPKNGIPEAANDLAFSSYQWYRVVYDAAGNETVELLDGETGQFYREDGGLNGIYFVMLTTTDGETYRSCDIEARPNTRISPISSDMSMSIFPCPAHPNSIVCLSEPYVRLRVLSSDGHIVSDTDEAGMCFTAPATAGLYIVQAQFADGRMRCGKLVIRY